MNIFGNTFPRLFMYDMYNYHYIPQFKTNYLFEK